jgi:hypothetical protein
VAVVGEIAGGAIRMGVAVLIAAVGVVGVVVVTTGVGATVFYRSVGGLAVTVVWKAGMGWEGMGWKRMVRKRRWVTTLRKKFGKL